FEQRADRRRVLLEKRVLADHDGQLLVERDTVFGIEDLADLYLLFRQRGERLRELPQLDLARIERLLHGRERNRRDLDVGLGKTVLVERRLEPEMTGGGEAIDADGPAFEIGDRPDRRALLGVVAGAEAARTLARDRRDERRRHAFGGGEDDAI